MLIHKFVLARADEMGAKGRGAEDKGRGPKIEEQKHPIIKRLWKIFNTKCVYFVQKPWNKRCSCFWTYFWCFSKCVAAPSCISIFFKRTCGCSWKISMNDFWKKMCIWSFFWSWLLLEIFQCFLMNVRLLLKSIKRKKCAS